MRKQTSLGARTSEVTRPAFTLRSEFAVLTAAALAIAPMSASAAVRNIPSAADTTLFESTSGNLGNGAGPHFFVGTNDDGNTRRGLLRFDLPTVLPSGSIVSSAALQLYQSSTNGTQTVQIHQVSASWGEGASNAGSPGGGGTVALAGDATWRHRFFNTQNWIAPGGDFLATPSGTFSAGNSQGAVTAPSSAGLVSDVQGWLDGSLANNGWLLRLTNESSDQTAKRFDTRENSNAARRPQLTVTFRVGGDANSDDIVNIGDFSILAANFNQALTGGPDVGDFNRNGTVEIGDFSILAANFNRNFSGPAAALPRGSAVPEPAFLSLAALVPLAARRRR